MRGAKKSRNGCARCKTLRLKCGEEVPACGRCLRLDLECPGYDKPLRWVDNHTPRKRNRTNKPNYRSDSTNPKNTPANEELAPSQSKSVSTADYTVDSPLLAQVLCDTGIEHANKSFPCLWNEDDGGVLSAPDDLWLSSCNASYTACTKDSRPESMSMPYSQVDLSQLLEPSLMQENERHDSPELISSTAIPDYSPEGNPLFASEGLSLGPHLTTPSWVLIEYYFKEVAGLFSSYDGVINPFRSTVSSLWSSSLLMCRTMQSMAAACLVNEFPQLKVQGQKLRNEAIIILSSGSSMDNATLLALLMLGQTASWHDPNDLGIPFFNLLQNYMNTTALDEWDYTIMVHPSNSFFKEALVYWEMLLSFVADSDTVARSCPLGHLLGPEDPYLLQKFPHPWTGVARGTQLLVCEVGRLIHTERKRMMSRSFSSQDDITQAHRAIEQAKELEERLLSCVHPTEADVINPEDDYTPVWHICTVAEVYRDIGLLQLYRVFPDLVERRRSISGDTHSVSSSNVSKGSSMIQQSCVSDLSAETTSSFQTLLPPRGAFSTLVNTYIHQQKDTMPDQMQSPLRKQTPASHDDWLASFALRTIERLKVIPMESHTRCLQPFLLVATCSELGLAPPKASDRVVSLSTIEVSRARGFVLGRLSSFRHVLPPRPIDVCIEVVQEVWKRLDAGEQGTYWMDVMIEKGWETTMG